MDIRKQSIVAANCLIKVESILKQCGLERVVIDAVEGDEIKQYVVLDELKEAIRIINRIGR